MKGLNKMKCLVPNCDNQEWQGAFVGNLCKPCHIWLSKEAERLKNEKEYSQAYRNALNEVIEYLKSAELIQVADKWDKNKK